MAKTKTKGKAKTRARQVTAAAAAPLGVRAGTGVVPPAREGSSAAVSADRALTLGAVYRAVQIIAGVVGQLELTVARGDAPIDPPLFVRQPEIGRSAASTLRRTAVSLACHGNAYWRIIRSDRDGSPAAISVLDPQRVTVVEDPETGAITYDLTTRAAKVVRGLKPADRVSGDVVQLRLLELPGAAKGLGPIQAARAELAGALDVRDWGANWFAGSGVPAGGTLTTDQALTPTQAAEYSDAWAEARTLNATAVLGKGLTYEASLLNPSDALWLEAQRFSVNGVARLFGIPPTWMLADGGQGGGITYTNLQDARNDAVLTTFLAYANPIEEAFTLLTPRGQAALLRTDALLRASTNQRYASYTQGLNGGWLTLDEVRAAEGLPPLAATGSGTGGDPQP